MSKQVKLYIGLVIGMTLGWFIFTFFQDNGMELAEVIFRSAVYGIILAIGMGIYVFVTIKSEKRKMKQD